MKPKFFLSLSSIIAVSITNVSSAQESAPTALDPVVDEVAANAATEREVIIQKLTALLEEVEQNGASSEKLDQIGDLYLRGGDASRAVLLYQKAIADYGGTEDLFLKLARVMGLSGSPERAVDVLKVGLERFPESEVLTFEIGKAYVGLKKGYAAISNLMKVIESSPEKQEYRYYLADAYRLQKKWTEASEIIDALLEEETELLMVHLMKGDLLLAQGEKLNGVRFLENLLEEHPDSEGVKKVLVHAYQLYAYEESQSGRLNSAVGSMRDAVEVLPRNTESQVVLASFLDELGEHEEAEAVYKGALGQNPNYLEAYILYGRMLEQLDRTPEAATLYQAGLSKSREAGVEGAVTTFKKLLGIRI